MSWLQYFQKLYSLDTLDTRFTVPATSPPRPPQELQLDQAKPSSPKPSRPSSTDDVRPSLWKTPEFFIYYFAFITVVPMMIKAGVDASSPSHPDFSTYSHLLSDGWILGRKVDNSDGQYASFRENIPYLVMLLILHPLLRRLYDFFSLSNAYTTVRSAPGNPNGLTQGLSATAAADARQEQRISFDWYFAFVFLAALHGFSSVKIFLILYINYKLAKNLPKEYLPAATWIFNIGILFANEFGRGYPYARIAQFLHLGPASEASNANWGTWLDHHGGLIPRWEVLFNFTILRLISFNMDYYWSLQASGGSPIEKKQLDPSNLSERDRTNTPAKPTDYSFRNYIAYSLYSPLYLAGPIVTFNDYISQLRYRAYSITKERTILYAIRFLIVLLTMEFLIHYVYAVAIFSAKPKWEDYTPFQINMLGFLNLHHIWLKLLIPWRFFRLWALIDGIDPPENMARCMSNNYSALAFWRGWHRSYNRWVVRYIFIPLGGSAGRGTYGKVKAVVNFLIVFTFVALWHDINLRLLTWGWLITLFVIPEITATVLFPAKKWKAQPNAFRILCGVGAIFNILMMMVANLVGFAIGVDGLKQLVGVIIGSPAGLIFFITSCTCLFIGSQVMFEVREQEKRQGIRMKC